jgi:hypothetical protein
MIFNGAAPARPLRHRARFPSVHHDKGGVLRRDFNLAILPTAKVFRGHIAPVIGVELLVGMGA